ncbi:Dam family site-specific DNA-(adenine-N6)-methyltransferase [Oscillospiraceae bacterium N12]|jgi:DNA adenine methylase|uniref:Site-specific DNA-methyltransferase (adenine-specific) n=1 Tax=Jilunia laotingensis TaxID=2763675 RepID=A0A926F4T4_9BACT|nr:Dam family site-specific DNA-(adenine-N6)-methyltransferase [Jilunia laotingensis]MBC8594701.1 Dam family site-specific DNA-(adenine-N6)-methyltransferase [Jilunia laotingensis]
MSEIIRNKSIKPFLKWAGGKTQLIGELENFIPSNYNTYIEAFLGGGALFFHLHPPKAILSDINPELINCYICIRDNVDVVISLLKTFENNEGNYYQIRSCDISYLTPEERAARFIFLNRTCFNGLYRENKKGEFNVPYGKYVNPKICDEKKLYDAHEALQNVKLICGNYKTVLRRYAQHNDFIFLDPPYVPIGKYSDFQRYNKDFFYDDDHIELRDEFKRLINIGAKVILTNSNTEFVHELYAGFPSQTFETKRLISSRSETRTGQDLVIYSTNGKKKLDSKLELLANFPGTRYMGSKYKLLPFLWDSIKELEFKSVLDAFSGSGCVSYMLKQKGIEVYSNDFMAFSANITKSIVENSKIRIEPKDIELLLSLNRKATNFITTTFKDLYFNDEDNLFLDNLIANINQLEDKYKKAIAYAAITRACMKKRPRGIFTYTGERYDDGRRDLQLSLQEHFLENIEGFNKAVFDNGQKNISYNKDVFDLDVDVDLVYFDPPYLTAKSDNDYIRRYHFVEGLIKNWHGVQIDFSTKTKKFKKYPSPFDSKSTVNDALDKLFCKFQKSILVVSYSSNSIPSKEEMIEILSRYKDNVKLKEIDYKYSFGNQNHKIGDNSNFVKEYLFIAT